MHSSTRDVGIGHTLFHLGWSGVVRFNAYRISAYVLQVREFEAVKTLDVYEISGYT